MSRYNIINILCRFNEKYDNLYNRIIFKIRNNFE